MKFWSHEIPTRKILDPRNTHEKKCWTHEIPERKNIGPTKYLREKMDPQRHDGMVARDPQDLWWHETHGI